MFQSNYKMNKRYKSARHGVQILFSFLVSKVGSDFLSFMKTNHGCHLCSSAYLLVVPCVRMYAEVSPPLPLPHLQNKLPMSLETQLDIASFRSHLKTYLFNQTFH